MYPKANPPQSDGTKATLEELLKQQGTWVEEKLQLDPRQAKMVPVPARGFNRDGKKPVTADDLEGNWALAQAWKKMMTGKKPALEPLAQLTPHDNYYVHFKTFAKFLEASDLCPGTGTRKGSTAPAATTRLAPAAHCRIADSRYADSRSSQRARDSPPSTDEV